MKKYALTFFSKSYSIYYPEIEWRKKTIHSFLVDLNPIKIPSTEVFHLDSISPECYLFHTWVEDYSLCIDQHNILGVSSLTGQIILFFHLFKGITFQMSLFHLPIPIYIYKWLLLVCQHVPLHNSSQLCG